jgi:hypothetical protein
VSSARPPVTQILDVPGIQLLRYERALTDEEMTVFLEESTQSMNKALEEKMGRMVMIVDVDNATRGTATQRKAQADWQEEHQEYFKNHVICGVFIASSPIVRGALRAVGWLKPFPYPHEITGNIQDAVQVAVTKLEEAGMAIPTEGQLQSLYSVYRIAA